MERNIKELNGNHKHIGNINGYDIYVPSIYYNHISYLNKNCPVWIKTSEDGECCVIILSNDETKANEKEISNYILKNLPSRAHVSCSNIQHPDCHPLSCVAIDNEGIIRAKIVIKENEDSLIVDSVSYNNKDVLLKLRQHLLSEHNIQLYTAIVLQFNTKTVPKDTIELLGAIYDESRKAYILQLI